MKTIQFKDCRKAVNQAKYSATAERKAHALKLLAKLTKAISNLEEVESVSLPSRKKSNKLAKKVRRTKGSRNLNSRLERTAQKQSLTAIEKRASKSFTTKVENLDDLPTRERPFGTRVEIVTPNKEYKAPRTTNDFVIREGETAEIAYRRMKSERLALAKAEAEATALAEFEATL